MYITSGRGKNYITQKFEWKLRKWLSWKIKLKKINLRFEVHTRHIRVKARMKNTASTATPMCAIRVLRCCLYTCFEISAARAFAAHRRIYFRTSKRPPFHVATVMEAPAPRRVSSASGRREESPGIVVVPKYRSEQIMRRVTNALNCTSTARSFGNASRKRANKLNENRSKIHFPLACSVPR